MDDATATALLREHVAWGVRPGARVVMRQTVVDAGHDVEAVDEWITARGGERLASYWLLPGEVFFRARRPSHGTPF